MIGPTYLSGIRTTDLTGLWFLVQRKLQDDRDSSWPGIGTIGLDKFEVTGSTHKAFT